MSEWVVGKWEGRWMVGWAALGIAFKNGPFSTFGNAAPRTTQYILDFAAGYLID